jgi:hypothetical protein
MYDIPFCDIVDPISSFGGNLFRLWIVFPDQMASIVVSKHKESYRNGRVDRVVVVVVVVVEQGTPVSILAGH